MSNGQATRGGGHPPQWRHVSDLDQQTPAQANPNQHQQQWPEQQWPAPPQDYQPYGYPNTNPAPPQYAPQHNGHAPQHNSHAPQHNGHAPQHNGHAPQHDGHAPQYPDYHYPEDNTQQGAQAYGQPAAQHQPYFGQQSAPPASAPFTPSFEQYVNGHSHGPDMYRNQEPARPPEPAPTTLRDQLRGAQYDQWQAAPQSPRGYDLGSYMPAGNQASPDYGQPVSGRGYGGQTSWQQQDGYDPHGYDEHAGTLPVAADHDDPDDADYDYDEPPKRRRGLLIVSSLVGAIIVGGGLAYGYKTILGPSGKSSAPPVIKADGRPSKIQPVEPGGKQFANADSKLMGRLESDGGSTSGQALAQSLSASAADNDPTGVRKVSTVTIGRDGAIAAPSADPRMPPPVTQGVPGMNLDYGPRGPAFPAAQSTARSVPAPSSGSAGAPMPQPQPQMIARAAPMPQPDIPASQPVSASPPLNPRRQLLPPPGAATQAPKRTAPIEAPSALAAPKPATSGFVAVLSSQKSRMDALKAFADLQQKYGGVLQNKIPDVQEADLSAKGLGTMYRAVVGPPGSREAANDICAQLKGAGYTGCWITAY